MHCITFRKNGLSELARILSPHNQDLYETLVKDFGETQTKYQEWWLRMSNKYQWKSVDNGNWEINFDTREIYLSYN